MNIANQPGELHEHAFDVYLCEYMKITRQILTVACLSSTFPYVEMPDAVALDFFRQAHVSLDAVVVAPVVRGEWAITA